MTKKKVETPEELSAEEQAVTDAAQKVADAKATLAQAQAEHEEAVAEHAAAVEAALPEVDPAIHIGVQDTHGNVSYVEHPEAKDKLPKLNIGGQNHEHVTEGKNGAWIYRRM